MKKFANINTQNSKISDFFHKVPNNIKKTEHDNKRKACYNDKHNGQVSHKSLEKFSPNCKKLKHDENCVPENGVCVSSSILKTQNPDGSFKVTTPEKCLRPSESMKTPTPQKNPGSGGSNGRTRTPQSSKKYTPKKLFERSPKNLDQFNVQVLKNFVNVSPSTSNVKILLKNSPQNNHVAYLSPKRSSPAQKVNENTPNKSPKPHNSLTPKIRTKLNFTNTMKTPDKVDENNGGQDFKVDIKLEFDSFLNAEFNDDFECFDNACNNVSSLTFGEAQYCQVLEVTTLSGKIKVKLKSDENGKIGWCSIEEFWVWDYGFKKGDRVYIQGVEINGEWVVNNKNGFLVYEPDLLVPCTSVVGSLYCKRKTVLSDRFRGFDSDNRIMIIGVLAHKLLQQALKQKLKEYNEIENLLKSLLCSKETVRTLYESNLSLHEIETELKTFVPKLVTFINEYVECSSINNRQSDEWQGKISNIEDIEENLWCPQLGVKGKIDVTIKSNTDIVPLELKTGRATVSLDHRGQVVLYIMMMNKFGYKVSSGLLLYLREGILKEVKATEQEMRDLLILRNELAYFLTRHSLDNDYKEKIKVPELPEPLYNNSRACLKCPYSTICTSYLKFEKHDISSNKTIREVQKNATSHLTENHLDYFLRWSSLLTMESEYQQGVKPIKLIYTTPPEKREALGRCIINVKIKFVGDSANGLYEHTFEREGSNRKSLTSYDIVENNYVVVSCNSRPAVATGFVTAVTASEIGVTLDRNLNLKYKNQFFHLDSYDSNSTYTFNMTSLAVLLENTPRSAELRNIIIDKQPPEFLSKLPSVIAKRGAPILRRLNTVQQKAVLRALCAKQYFLIKGMPGTGKSATIVALIQLLVELDKSVLVTSHTHSAIDNICIRLQKRGIDFLRLGSESKIDAKIKGNSEATLTEKCMTPEKLEEVYNRYKVIAVTCLGSGHSLLSKRTFDVCIVDESTQVIQTALVRPLYAAKTFVLIGDPNQLAPTVRNRDAIEQGMSQSLFERLENTEGTIALNLNYRMNKTITNLANILTYGGQLQTATDEVANRVLAIPNLEVVKSAYSHLPWLIKSLDVSLESAVQLIDTGPVWQLPQDVKWVLKNAKSLDSSDFKNCINVYETAIVVTLVKALLQGGVASHDIGVIATYRAQVTQISTFLEKFGVDVSTVDQFQGRDKHVVIYSCTKSTDPAKFSSEASKFVLLEDKRRLTVAITRAKRKLLIVGDVSTLQKYNTFSIILPELMKNCVKFEAPASFISDF